MRRTFMACGLALLAGAPALAADAGRQVSLDDGRALYLGLRRPGRDRPA